jgi:hypothetical protein
MEYHPPLPGYLGSWYGYGQAGETLPWTSGTIGFSGYWTNLYRITGSGDDPAGTAVWMAINSSFDESGYSLDRYTEQDTAPTSFHYGGPGYC